MNILLSILAGGKGTRLGELGKQIPKALLEVAGRPLITYPMEIMNRLQATEQDKIVKVILTGYKGRQIFDEISKIDKTWNVFDTGYFTQTGGRFIRAILQARQEKHDFDLAIITYCDGYCNINLGELIKYHLTKGKIATLTAVKPISRFGELTIKDGLVSEFKEKYQSDTRINGGFIVFDMKKFTAVQLNDKLKLEDILFNLAKDGELAAFEYPGKWSCIDSERDIDSFEKMLEEEGR